MQPEPSQYSPLTASLLRGYARGMIWAGGLLLLAVLVVVPPDARGWGVALAGALAVAVLRYGSVSLSKFAYVTMTVVPVGALTLLGWPVPAAVAAGVGTLLGDATRRKG
ncbi:MAG: hypothetical protein JO040_11605, partial [Gemmatimonadetes bacterium]|nr:hypothetical protein [Gemmatimonadota bacterium]